MTITLTRKEVKEMRKLENKKEMLKKATLVAKKVIIVSGMVVTIFTYLLANGQTIEVQASESNVVVQSGDTLYRIAKDHSLSVEELKHINQLKNDVIYQGQVLQVENKQVSAPVSKSISTYVVKEGDNLWKIASKNGMTVEKLQQLNELTSDVLYPNQVLKIEESKKEIKKEIKKETPKTILKKSFAVYTVVAGDTFYELEEKLGVSREDIKEWNGKETNSLIIGERLAICGDVYEAVATFNGSVDNHSIEVEIDGKPMVIEVGYQLSNRYEKYAGKSKKIQFINIPGQSSHLISVN